MIGLAILLQTAAATVGDTIWVTRTVPVTPRQTVRPVEWEPADPVESVGRPRVIAHDGRVEIRYSLTAWRTGRHRVEIPGPLVLGPDGAVDSLPPEIVTLEIASVLPRVSIDSPIAPQPRAGVVPRPAISLIPLLVFWVVAILLLLPLWWWWRRRGKPGLLSSADPDLPAVPVDRWADAGERRAVASLAAVRLRAAVDRQTAELDPTSDAEVRGLLGALDRTRFGLDATEDALALFHRAAQLVDRLGRGTA